MTRKRFGSPTPTPLTSAPAPTPVPEVPNAPPTVFYPRRFTRSNVGQPPDVLDPSSHFVTQHTGVTDHLSVPPNTSPIEHYYNTLVIWLPSRRYGRTSSQGCSKRILYTPDQTERDSQHKIQHSCLNSLYLASLNWLKLITVTDSDLTTLNSFSAELLRYSELSVIGDLLLDYLNPALFIVLMNSNGNPNLTEAMNGPDSADFMAAMEVEIETLIEMRAYVVVDKETSSVWAFRRKRFPDGVIRKLKACISARGFVQKEGIDYFETFAPVVQWMTARMCLIMIILLGIENKQIDYITAFFKLLATMILC